MDARGTRRAQAGTATRPTTVDWTCCALAPRTRQSTNRPSVAELQVWFRVVHVAEDGHPRALDDACREQTVEIALGPKGAFNNGNVSTVTRRVAADRVASAPPEPEGRSKPPRGPRTPRVVEFLRKALEWQALIESGDVRNQAEIARREGISRARVTQVMGMLRLAPEIQHHILAMAETARQPAISERALRTIGQIEDLDSQKLRFQDLIGDQVCWPWQRSTTPKSTGAAFSSRPSEPSWRTRGNDENAACHGGKRVLDRVGTPVLPARPGPGAVRAEEAVGSRPCGPWSWFAPPPCTDLAP